MVTGTQTAEDIVKQVKDAFEDWDIKLDKSVTCNVMGITVDTANTMEAFCKLLRSEFPEIAIGGCVDHILNLSTELAFGADDPMMQGARKLVQAFAASTQALGDLLNIQRALNVADPVGPIQDVVTRWWSTYKMLERLLRLKPFFGVLEAKHEFAKNMTSEEWDVLAAVASVLKPFADMQEQMEGQKYIAISLVPSMIASIRTSLVAATVGTDPKLTVVRALAGKLLNEKIKGFNAYWGNGAVDTLWDESLTPGNMQRQKGIRRIALVAAALDPRTKKLHGFGEKDKGFIWADVRRRMGVVAETSPVVAAVPGPAVTGQDNLFWDNLVGGGSEDGLLDGVNDLDSELERYKAEVQMKMKIAMPVPVPAAGAAEVGPPKPTMVWNNPLAWWEQRQKLYPHLAKLAAAILPIQATSASTERVFSVAGRTISDERTRLLPENAEILIFLKGAWKLVDEMDETL